MRRRQNHTAFMHRAIKLALRGKGRVSPNPCVGCVIVKNGKIVGEGYHQRFGGPHAEVLALAAAGGKARGATAYITLEPCTHWGKTPPCVSRVIQAGLRQIFIAMQDPNPIVLGGGIKALKKAGIKVHVGLESHAAQMLNRAYITWITSRRPHVVLKMATTLDGKIATAKGESRWISSEASRRLVHKLRSESDAVLVGANTALRDNPSLTSHGAGRNPLRIVLDPRLKTPLSLRLYNDKNAETIVITAASSTALGAQKLKKKGVQILRTSLRFKKIDLLYVLREIAKRNVSQLLVEGGGITSWGFVERGLVDEFYFFIAPKILGGQTAPTSVEGTGFGDINRCLKLRNISVSLIGEDILIHADAGTKG